MDKQIIEWLNIFDKYKVDDDRIRVWSDPDWFGNDIQIHFTAFNKKDLEKLKELWWARYNNDSEDYYYHDCIILYK